MTRLLLALLALVLLSNAAAAKLPCLTKSQVAGKQWKYRQVEPGKRCYYIGARTRHKDEFEIKPVKPAKSSSGGVKNRGHAAITGDAQPSMTDNVTWRNAKAGVASGPLGTNAGEERKVMPPDRRSEHTDTPPVSATATPGRADQVRLERAFQSIAPTTWQTHIKSLSVLGIYRLEYRREFPAVWAMASRWP